MDARHRRRRTRRSRRSRATPPTRRTRTSASARVRAARRSSAASTAAPGAHARVRRATRASPTARTPSTFAPPTPQRTPTRRRRALAGRSTPRRPTPTITAEPSDPANSTGASFSFTSNEGGSSFECKLDASGWSACSSPNSYTGLGDGSHTFQVRATDAAGNTDASPASRTWTIDTAAPSTSITAQPNDPTNASGATFSFTSNEGGSTFECNLDAGGWSACPNPKSYSGLADGAHTFDVRATDAAGNTDPTPASFNWTVDTGAPNTSITSQPGNPANSADADFGFTSTEGGSTFECRLDGGAWSACTSPKSYTGLADGAHTFDVRATDAAGNTDPTPGELQLDDRHDRARHHDHVAAERPRATPPTRTSPLRRARAARASSAGSTAALGPPAPSYTGLTDGPHTFDVRATDAAGNTDPTPASVTWTIDTAAPNTSITAQPNDPTNSTAPSFSFSSSESGSTFECNLDAGGWSACPSPKSYSGLADGPRTFQVRSTDAAGNTDASPASFTWTVDTVAPDTQIDNAPTSPTNSQSASFDFSAPGSAAFECRIDGGAWSACASPKSYTGLAEGTHTFDVARNRRRRQHRRLARVAHVDDRPDRPDRGPHLPGRGRLVQRRGLERPGRHRLRRRRPRPRRGLAPDRRRRLVERLRLLGDERGVADRERHGLMDVRLRRLELPVRRQLRPPRARGRRGGQRRAPPRPGRSTSTRSRPRRRSTRRPRRRASDADADFAFSADQAGSTFECRLDGGAWTACTLTALVHGAGRGGAHVRRPRDRCRR